MNNLQILVQLLVIQAGLGWMVPQLLAAADPSSTIAKQVEVVTSVEPRSVAIAESFELRMTVLVPSGWLVRFDEQEPAYPVSDIRTELALPSDQGTKVAMPGPETLGPWIVDRRIQLEDLPVEQKRQWQHILKLSSNEAGQFQVPSLVAWAGPMPNQLQAFPSQAVSVTVRSELSEQGAADAEPPLRDLKPLVQLPTEPNNRYFYWLAVATSTTITGLLLIAFVRWRGRKPGAGRRAVLALTRLDAERLIEQGQNSDYYARLTDILRRFIEEEYGILAPSLTTREFLQQAESSRELDSATSENIKQILSLADRVKYASWSAEATETQQARQVAVALFGRERGGRR